MTLVDELRTLPKAELHQHLDGALRPDTAVELAAMIGMPLTLHEARSRMVGPERCRSQAELLEYFELPLVLMQTAESLERSASELVEDMGRDGVRYAEIRWAPRLHLRRGLSVAAVISAVASGVARASSRPDSEMPVVGLIVTAMRSDPPAANVQLAQVAADFGWPVVGFDLAGPEAEWPAPPHAAAFQAAAAGGLRLTSHAGEVPGPQRIIEVLDFGVSRIAHGVTAADDDAAISLLRSRHVTLDLCPTSNVQTAIVRSLGEHPVARLHRAGVSVTISTDDRTVSATTLSDELARTTEALSMTDGELAAIALNGFHRAFAPADVMRPLTADASRAWEAWRDGRLTG